MSDAQAPAPRKKGGITAEQLHAQTLAANHDRLQSIVQLRATTAVGEVIDGLNVLVHKAALGDRDARQALRQLHRHLDRGRAIISVDLPGEPPANGT